MLAHSGDVCGIAAREIHAGLRLVADHRAEHDEHRPVASLHCRGSPWSVCGSVRPGEIELGLLPAVAHPGSGRGLHVQVVGAGHAPRAPAALVARCLRARVVGEMADPVGVQLRRQPGAAAAQEQPAPERVVLMPLAEGVQFDRLQRRRQRILRRRPAHYCWLNLPPIFPQVPARSCWAIPLGPPRSGSAWPEGCTVSSDPCQTRPRQHVRSSIAHAFDTADRGLSAILVCSDNRLGQVAAAPFRTTTSAENPRPRDLTRASSILRQHHLGQVRVSAPRPLRMTGIEPALYHLILGPAHTVSPARTVIDDLMSADWAKPLVTALYRPYWHVVARASLQLSVEARLCFRRVSPGRPESASPVAGFADGSRERGGRGARREVSQVAMERTLRSSEPVDDRNAEFLSAAPNRGRLHRLAGSIARQRLLERALDGRSLHFCESATVG